MCIIKVLNDDPGEDPQTYACKLLEVLLLEFKGKIDEVIDVDEHVCIYMYYTCVDNVVDWYSVSVVICTIIMKQVTCTHFHYPELILWICFH